MVRESLGLEQIVAERLMRERQTGRAQRRDSELERLAVRTAQVVALYEPPDMYAYQVIGDQHDTSCRHDVPAQKQPVALRRRRVRNQHFGERKDPVDQVGHGKR